MIKQLRKRFITISIAAVASVMILLFAGVNIVNHIYVTSKLDETLDTIILNHGRMPAPEEPFEPAIKPEAEDDETDDETDDGQDEDEDDDDSLEDSGYMRKPGPGLAHNKRQFDKEAPFLTRFFSIRFNEKGEPTDYNLEKIAAVSTDDVDEYARIAFEHGEGSGYENGYRFRVTANDDGSFSALFLDSHKEISSEMTLLTVSAAVTVLCIALICVIIILFSKRAMEPVIQSDIRQKQFITDAGHELKTPITVINTCLSVLEMEVGKQKWIDKARGQTDKLRDLVNSLVTLSKSDEEHKPVKTDFDVSAAVSETAESFSDFAEKNGHIIKTDIESGITLSADEFSVRQLVSILLDNALKYATGGSDIDFTLKKHKKGILITVSNECENIDSEELPKLFDRFYRADKSRNSEKGGFGLGLSIARGICENHKGYIKADTEDGRIVFSAYIGNI